MGMKDGVLMNGCYPTPSTTTHPPTHPPPHLPQPHLVPQDAPHPLRVQLPHPLQARALIIKHPGPYVMGNAETTVECHVGIGISWGDATVGPIANTRTVVAIYTPTRALSTTTTITRTRCTITTRSTRPHPHPILPIPTTIPTPTAPSRTPSPPLFPLPPPPFLFPFLSPQLPPTPGHIVRLHRIVPAQSHESEKSHESEWESTRMQQWIGIVQKVLTGA